MKRSWKLVAAAVTGLLLHGCASLPDSAREGSGLFGGGFSDSEVRKGLFRIDVKSNVAILADVSSARFSWKLRAEQLCGSSEYQELAVHEYSFDSSLKFMGLAPKIAGMSGYALCGSAGMSAADAIALVRRPN
jgi:hypothetical protein